MKNRKYKISLEHAKKNKLFYFVATTTVYRKSDGRCLILKRSMREKVHAGKWCVPGGKLEHEDMYKTKCGEYNGVIYRNNMIVELVKREAKEECGLSVGKVTYLDNLVFIRPDFVPVVCFKFASVYQSGKIKLAKEFDDYLWVNKKELKRYDTIISVVGEIKKTIALFKNL